MTKPITDRATRTQRTTPTRLEQKLANVTFKRIATDGSFEGYASVFGVADLGQDVVERGAFRACLRTKDTSDIKLLFQHDPAEPIGVWDEIREDTHGLYVRGRLLCDVSRAREVLSLMRAGAVTGLSIGFRTVHGVRDRKTGVRRLSEIDLWEISVVTFPMQPDARIAAVKAAHAAPTRASLERLLTRDAGLTRSQARTLLRHGFTAMHQSKAVPARKPTPSTTSDPMQPTPRAGLSPPELAERMRHAVSELRNAHPH